MEQRSDPSQCPLGYANIDQDDVVISTNWNYLQTMKMNQFAYAANLGPVTRPGGKVEGKPFIPWFWPDNELAEAVKLRQKIFLEDQSTVLNTADDDPIVRAASQQLLWLQATYLAEHFPEKYAIEQNRKFGKLIINKTTDDKFSIRPDIDDWHPLAISGMLGQEDILLVKRNQKNGKQVLTAGFLATPSFWNLADFIGSDMDTIHKNEIKDYTKPTKDNGKPRLKDTVDKTLENMREYPDGLIGRNNIFVVYSPSLAQHEAVDVEPKKVITNPDGGIYLRSERETLARLPAAYDDFIVFTIKPNMFRMSDVRRERGEDFTRTLATNSVLRYQLTSHKSTKGKDKYDFTQILQRYLSANQPQETARY